MREFFPVKDYYVFYNDPTTLLLILNYLNL